VIVLEISNEVGIGLAESSNAGLLAMGASVSW
jgi:hypothetical protein